jgi:predicted RNA-binding Zn-ribbon protein involved in translation (DUF1610 family)
MALDLFEMELDLLTAQANLDNETCGLKHIKSDPAENHPAVDYLCNRMGYTDPDGNAVADAELRIPVCADCVDALLGNEWILFYCVHCGESQWMLKEKAKNGYPEDTKIIALRSCPICHKKSQYSGQ